jgi:hypothetical protein
MKLNPAFRGPNWRKLLTLTLSKGSFAPLVAWKHPDNIQKRLVRSRLKQVANPNVDKAMTSTRQNQTRVLASPVGDP